MFEDSLFRNSVYLMLATAVMAGFGFFFWLITARLYSTENIGLATTLISIMSLIATFSLIGFDAAFVRFLPGATDRDDKINTGMILVGITSFILSTGFVLLINVISPRLNFVDDNHIYALLFIFSCVMSALNVLTDSVFVSGRQSKYTLIINTIFSIAKMLLPFAFVHWGAMGIYLAVAGSQTLGFILSIIVMIWKFEYHPQFKIVHTVLTSVWKFSLTNYFSGVLGLLPSTVLPILITNRLGPESSAYYYMAMMIGNLLYVIPWATARALFAESSNDEKSLSEHIKKAIQLISLLMTPAIIVLLIGSTFILNIFGANYAEGGAEFLRIIAITGIAVGTYAVFGSLFRVSKDLIPLIISNVCYSTTIILLAYFLLPFGLRGVGIAWLSGNIVASAVSYALYIRKKRRESIAPKTLEIAGKL